MSWEAPPPSIFWEVERWIPGIWRQVFNALNAAYRREPFTVTSWWRSPSRNQQVSGHRDSQHLCALAFDCAPGSAAVEAALRGVGFRTVRYGTHVHAQVLEAGLARTAGLLDAIGV